jgi:hypothetical protein
MTTNNNYCNLHIEELFKHFFFWMWIERNGTEIADSIAYSNFGDSAGVGFLLYGENSRCHIGTQQRIVYGESPWYGI